MMLDALHSPDADAHDLPADWEPESYPSCEREWLAASFIAPGLRVGIAVLVADSLVEDGCVYPLAMTTDVGETVDARHYDLLEVAPTTDDALDAAQSMMQHVSSAFDAGNADFVTEAMLAASEDARQTVRVGRQSDPLRDALAGTPLPDECSCCGAHLTESMPLFGQVTVEPDLALDDCWCPACEFEATDASPDVSGVVVVMTQSRDDSGRTLVEDVQALQHR